MSRKQHGFTLVEIAAVMAVIGMLGAVALPSFVQNARKAKASEAVVNVKKIYDGARSYYEEEANAGRGSGSIQAQFPQSLAELATAGLIPSDLADGQEDGYAFSLRTADDGKTFALTAEPLVPGVTGDTSVATDQGGKITSILDSAAATMDACLRAELIAAISALNKLSDGAAMSRAQELAASPNDLAAAYAALTSSDPGKPSSIAALLQNVNVAADLPELRRGDNGGVEGGDTDMAKVVDDFRARLRAKLQPIITDPAIINPPSPSELSADTLALLAEAKAVAAKKTTTKSPCAAP